MAATAASSAAWPTTRGFEKLVELLEKPAFEQIPTSFPADLWEALFNGLAEDPECTEDQWARKLRSVFESSTLEFYTLKGQLEEYQAERAVELRYLRMKFHDSPCCSSPLAEVQDKEVLFDRVCLTWFSHKESAAEDAVLTAMRRAILRQPGKGTKRAREVIVTLSAEEAEFMAKWLNVNHAEAALEGCTPDEVKAHWDRVRTVCRKLKAAALVA